jgi:hypothetical protein
MASSSKRPRISDVAPASKLSNRAKSVVLRQVRDEGLPIALSERTASRQRQELANESTEYGPVICKVPVPTLDGADVEIPFQHPMAMLSAILKRSEWFRM